MTKNFFVFLVTVLLAFTANAQSLSAEQLMSRDIMAGSKVLSKDIKIYSYFNFSNVHPQFTTPEGRYRYVQSFLSARGGSFWDSDFRDATPKYFAAGPGLYFAIDPHISRTFGNYFVQLNVPRGTKFINIVAPISIKKATQDALVAEGIVTRQELSELVLKYNGFYRDTLRLMVLPQYVKFRELVQRVFTQNELQFIEYNFNTSLASFCSAHSYSAFNYIGKFNPANPKEAVVTAEFQKVPLHSYEFTLPDLTTEESTELEAALKYRKVLDNVVTMRERGQRGTRDYILREYSASEYADVKSHTFSCEDEYARKK